MKKNPWTKEERQLLRTCSTPYNIQLFLDSIDYSTESLYRCPRSVLRDRKAHCFDGAVFAAAALQQLGYPPLIVDMQAVRDDDHVVALFRRNGRYGAIAKSNFAGLRFREPIYLSVRELVMSYFEPFFNLHKEKSLRQFTTPLNLLRYNKKEWQTNDETMEEIGLKLSYIKVYKLMQPGMIRALHRVDERAFEAGMYGANKAGIYDPNK